MLRSQALIGFLAISAVTIASATAQTSQQDSESVSCPRGGLSVYYARGEAAPSEQARLLIDRIRDEASRCRPDGIDVVTEIDTEREGSGAISLAMARLNNVADALVANGYPAEQIRLAAQANAEADMRPPMGGITVYFRQAGRGAGDASAPRPVKRTMPAQEPI